MIFRRIKKSFIDDTALSTSELSYAKKEYHRRVSRFSKRFEENVSKLEGEKLEVYDGENKVSSVRSPITKKEHSGVIDRLRGWSKEPDDFPVRIIKAWKADKNACEDCRDLADIAIDTTPLFIGNHTDEIYERTGGGMHDGCKCFT